MARWRRERCLVVVGLWWTICLVAGPSLGAEHRFDGVYAGKRSLVKGSGPDCPAADDVSVTIHGETLTFTHSVLKNVAEPFYPAPDGSFGETYTDEGGDIVRYHGRIVGDVIDVDVTNSSCEYHWRLKKQ
jgi:hypothetical protein